MTYYIEAFRKDGSQILGNLDGQNALRVRDYKRTRAYKQLINKLPRPAYKNVAYWLITKDNTVVEKLINERKPFHA